MSSTGRESSGKSTVRWRQSTGPEDLNNKTSLAGRAGGTGVLQPKRYRKRCEQQIGMSIQDGFAPLLRDCAQLMAAGEDTDKRTVRAPCACHGIVSSAGVCMAHACTWLRHMRSWHVVCH